MEKGHMGHMVSDDGGLFTGRGVVFNTLVI